MTIKKRSIPAFEMKRILNKAGQIEKRIIDNARWIFLSKDKKFYTFVRPNPNYVKGKGMPKVYRCRWNREIEEFTY